MNWFLWFLAVWFLLSAVITVWNVGNPKKATDAGTAAIMVVINALLIAGVFLFGAK